MRANGLLLFSLLSCCACFGQSISIGAAGGGMLTNDLSNQWVSSVSTRYAVGPVLAIGLPFGFGFEANALYRNESYQTNFQSTPGLSRASWEFPLLLKKNLPFPVIKPFVEGGYAPRTLEGTSYATSQTSHGLVIGAGVQLGLGRLHLMPAIRYTHWSNAPLMIMYSDGPEINLTQNQVDLLVGVTWKVR